MNSELEASLRRTIERERKARAAAETLVEERTEALRVALQTGHQQRMLALMNLVPCPMAVTEKDGTILVVNHSTLDMLGLSNPSEIIGRNWSDWTGVDAPLNLATSTQQERIFQLVNVQNKQLTIGLTIGLAHYENQDRCIFIMRDLSEQRRHEEALQHQATHDNLTGLPNRVLLVDRTQQIIARAQRHGSCAVILFIDLDKFKIINDTLGHASGDEALREVARRLKSLIRTSDTVARMGGDEFVVVCELGDKDSMHQLSARVIDALSTPVAITGTNYTLGGSVGAAIYPQHGTDVELLLKRADIAMYQSKLEGGSRCCYFTEEMQTSIDRTSLMEKRLRIALTKHELVMHYQPQIDARSGKFIGVEALVRWDSPDYGFLAPNSFLSLAQEAKLMYQLDSYVLNAVVQQIKRWHQSGYGWRRVAVNMSATRFVDPNFLHELTQCIATHGIPAHTLVLEMTESLSLNDPKLALQLMQQIKKMGMMLAIDDFGTGYSNLAYLKHFPADHLKVDQSFVRGLLSNPQDKAIVSTVIQLAHNLNMHAIAEGVETIDEAALLLALGVDELQGYWISKPQAPAAIEALFRNGINLTLPPPLNTARHSAALHHITPQQNLALVSESLVSEPLVSESLVPDSLVSDSLAHHTR